MNETPPAPPNGLRDTKYQLALSLTALGVVYGDIGTSPLYAIRECFYGEYGIEANPANILGVLSLIFWSLLIVISIKYLVLILRADNRGEGGILALMALARPEGGSRQSGRVVLIALGLFGAALLYGDGMITPAISVLSAVEGLHVATPLLRAATWCRSRSSSWSCCSSSSAAAPPASAPSSGRSCWSGSPSSPCSALRSIVAEPARARRRQSRLRVGVLRRTTACSGFLVLGSVFLVVTGGEALYADMGHFGRRPIRLDWFAVVLPALLLNYFGQGALLLGSPEASHNPFYRLAPSWALYPLVVLATVATVIASQAVISGAFSLTRQAIQLGYCPRLEIDHTSSEEIGQIYVPAVNWMLMLASHRPGARLSTRRATWRRPTASP